MALVEEGCATVRSERSSIAEAAVQLRLAASASKCWPCRCLRNSIHSITVAYAESERPAELQVAIREATSRLIETAYDCLGCYVCFPAIALDALNVGTEACPTEAVTARSGWPPLPGTYSVIHYHAPVAVCTLTDEILARAIILAGGLNIAIVGTCQTENLGIERIIQNVLANPNIRFLLLCGADSQRVVGHLPGQSLLALARNGVDDQLRIVGAGGRRPILRNLRKEAIEQFRRTVEVVDQIEEADTDRILEAAGQCAGRNPGPTEPFSSQRLVKSLHGYVPQETVADPQGYFVIYVDRTRRRLVLEHYSSSGVLDCVIEGRSAAEAYCPAVEHGLLSRLDHACYLGGELARAERALATGEDYVQDAAPEQRTASTTCGCHSSC